MNKEDLPHVLGLLNEPMVKMLIAAYKGALIHAHASVAGAAIVTIAGTLAPKQLESTKQPLLDNPQDVAARRTRAMALGVLDERALALEELGKVLEEDPNAHNYAQRAMVYTLIGQHDRALSDANAAVERAPLSADAYSTRATVYLARNALVEAQADTERAVQLAMTEAQAQGAAALHANHCGGIAYG